MDKYQINFLKGIIVSVDNVDGCGNFEINNKGNLIIVQNENYNITNYVLKIKNKDLLSVSYYINAWRKANIENGIASIPVDFNNPTTIIKIELNDGLVDDFDIQVILKNADKASWDKKYSKTVNEERIKNIGCILCDENTIHTLVFKHCCNKYSYSIVKWYAKGYMKNQHYSEINKQYFLEEQKINTKFYSNIECAFYVAAEISQFDKYGNLLVSTKINF